MSTTPFAPQLRPLSVGEVLDASFKVVRQSFGTLAACVLVVALPLNIIDTLILASTAENAFNLDSESFGTSDVSTGTQLAGGLLRGIINVVLLTIASAACFRAVSSVYLGEQPTVGESISFGARRVVSVILLSILYAIGLVIPFLLLVIPGIWLAVKWSVSYPALLFEGIGPVKSLARSFELTKDRWWPSFGALVVMYLIVVVISGILGLLFGATLIASLDNEALAAVIYTLVNTLSSLITLPLFAAVLTIIYFDLRVRKEGFDLHLLAQGVGSDAPTSAENVAASSGPGGYEAPRRGDDAPTEAPSGGFAPPQAPSAPPPGLQSGDPLAPSPERREGDGGTSS